MRKAVVVGVGVLALAMLVWAGGDPWKSKPFAKWTEDDVKLIFQSSPWAKPNLEPYGSWRPLGNSTADSAPGLYGKSAGGAPTDVKGGHAASNPADSGASVERDAMASRQAYTVLWWSSRTIRAASVRRAVLHGSMTEADAEKLVDEPQEDYQVLVKASNMAIFEKRGEKAFQNAAYLELKKSKQKLTPTKVTFQLGADDSVIGAVFHFPRKGSNGEPTISPDEKEIDFFVQIGDAKLMTDFDPRKMVDSKGADL
jgi:hypothetical protein